MGYRKKPIALVLSLVLLLASALVVSPKRAEASGRLSDDTWLLARLIYAEAAGESYVGKVAVGAVVMNRMRSGIFPGSIPGVIYDPWQFSSVGNWMFNSGPDQASVKAAVDAINGADPTNGALFYFNWHTVTNSWLWSRPFAALIGNHYFTY